MTQEQKQNYEKIYELVIDLQKKYWPYKGEIDKNQAFGQVINFVQSSLDKNKTLDPTDLKNFLPRVAKEILEKLSEPLEQEAPSIPPNLKDFVAEMDEARAKEEARREKLMSKGSQETLSRLLNLNQKIIAQNYPHLTKGVVNKVSRELTEDIINRIPPAAREDLSKPEDLSKAIDKNFIAEKLKNVGLEPKEGVSQELLRDADVAKTIKKVAAEPEIIKPIKEENLQLKEPSDKEVALPPETLRKFNQKPETQTFAGLYTLFDGQAGSAAFLTAANKIPALMIKNAVENASPEAKAAAGWQEIEEIVRKNVFIEDYEATIKALGLPEDHPFIQRIRDKMARLKEAQKIALTQKDYGWVRVLKHSRYWSQIVGRTEGIYDEELGIFLVQSPVPNWTQKGTYAYSLRQGLNKFNFIPNASKKTFRFITHGRYESFGGIIRGTIYQKALKPLLIRLGKTAVGKTAKTIFTKLSTRLAVKLGLSALTAGWGTLISFLPEIKKLVKGALTFFGGLLLMAAHYGTAALLGTIGGSIGGILAGGFLGFKLGAAIGTSFSIVGTIVGAIVGFVIGAIVGFFGGAGIQLLIDKIKSSLSGPPLLQKVASASNNITTSAVATSGNIVLGSIVGIGVGALLITQITSSAFLGPEGQQLTSPFIQVEKSASFSGKLGDAIEYKITIKAVDKSLENVKIRDQFSAVCEGTPPSLKSQSWEETEIQLGNTWEKSYSIQTNDSFNNCYISNNVDVIASVEGKSERSFAVASVIIGNPPMDCPHGWPTEYGNITQGPNASFSHTGQEAIDIGVGIGNEVRATHKKIGTVITGFDPPKYVKNEKTGEIECKSGGGNFVMMQGLCKGQTFYTWFFHLNSISVSSNPDINTGDMIGKTGTSGMCKPAPHLHYEFRPSGGVVKMIQDYVPKTVPPGCGSSEAAGPCGISW